jgi:hypothetical protein
MAMRIRTYDDHPLGLSWVVDDFLSRASHALVHDGKVWIVDPVDAEDAIAKATALGEPAAVIQLFGAHGRDCKAVAQRLGVPLHKMPESLPDAPFEIVALDTFPGWKEVALWWPEPRALVVGEAVGTGHLYAVGSGPVGVHPMRRLAAPPTALAAYAPLHLLVGHGAPLHGEGAAPALEEALDRSRKDFPKVLIRAKDMIRGALART